MTGTWCTEEVKLALKKGYTIEKIHQIVHWEDTSYTIFESFINTFLRIKQEASGYPEWVKADEDKDLYIKKYFEKEGIMLQKYKIKDGVWVDNIDYNEGLRAIAKLFLNNLWGRYCLKPNKRQNKYNVYE
eukprot:gene23213-28092_t